VRKKAEEVLVVETVAETWNSPMIMFEMSRRSSFQSNKIPPLVPLNPPAGLKAYLFSRGPPR
jgi:hypothetical protein